MRTKPAKEIAASPQPLQGTVQLCKGGDSPVGPPPPQLFSGVGIRHANHPDSCSPPQFNIRRLIPHSGNLPGLEAVGSHNIGSVTRALSPLAAGSQDLLEITGNANQMDSALHGLLGDRAGDVEKPSL